MEFAGIVLCGGRSSRMGYPKGLLPFGPERMLQRVVRIVAEVVRPIVVVAADGQDLPPLPGDVLYARDQRPNRGPLEGLLAGMAQLPHAADAAYVTSCDVPLLTADFVRSLTSRLGDADIVVPVEGPFAHPLAAVYRTSLKPLIAELLAADQLRPAFLFDRTTTRRVAVEELRQVDPNLNSLANLNHAQDYLDALQRAGFSPSPEILTLLGMAGPSGMK